MAIESVGYDGIIDELNWAKVSAFLGARFAVAGPDDWKVTIAATPDRSVRVAPGVGYGDGVLDTSNAIATVTSPVVGIGSRWDAIVARRTWTPTPGGTTVFTRVAGTSVRAVPALQNTPGEVADQPLALVEFVAGQTLPRTIINLRTWASKVHTADSLLALAGMPLGFEAVVDGVRYRRQMVGSTVETIAVEPQLASGLYTANFPVSSTIESRTYTVPLPVGRFRDAPQVIPSFKSTAGRYGRMKAAVTVTTPTNFTLVVYSSDGSAVAPAEAAAFDVAWVAVA